MKAYKIELLIIDFDGIGESEIKSTIEYTNYPNDCINPKVMRIIEKDIGKWSDDHPLNIKFSAANYYHEIFNNEIQTA